MSTALVCFLNSSSIGRPMQALAISSTMTLSRSSGDLALGRKARINLQRKLEVSERKLSYSIIVALSNVFAQTLSIQHNKELFSSPKTCATVFSVTPQRDIIVA